jgi:hypothetical protein
MPYAKNPATIALDADALSLSTSYILRSEAQPASNRSSRRMAVLGLEMQKSCFK